MSNSKSNFKLNSDKNSSPNSLVFKTTNMNPNILSEAELTQLAEQLWLCKKDAFTPEQLKKLQQIGQQRWQQGLFRSAKIGRGHEQQEKKSIRSDEILWLDPKDPELLFFAEICNKIQTELAQGLMLPIQSYELHWARYPANSNGYDEHLDQSKTKDLFHGERLITFVLYLNDSWQSEDGGQLKIRLPEQAMTIEPQCGTLMLFRSDSLWHQVLSAKKDRWSLTGWFRRN